MVGESREEAPFACAPVTVRSAFHGNVEERDGGTGEREERRGGGGEERRGVRQPSLISAERVCASCVSACPVGAMCFIPTLWCQVVWRSDHT